MIGTLSDSRIADHLHHLAHDGRVDIVHLPVEDLDRKRLSAVTDSGETIGITLPRDQKLVDGAVLQSTGREALVVHAGPQRWLRLRAQGAADALELGYHAGNLHWKVRFENGDLLVALSGSAGSYVARIAPMIASGAVSFSEETAA